MAKLIHKFNAHEHNPEQSTGSLPIGKYTVVIESSEVKPNKENSGGYLQLNLKVCDGPDAGSTGAYRLNLYHSSEVTVAIANRQLSAICHVTDRFISDDSAPLHNVPFVVEVGPQKNNPQYTEVKKVFDAQGNEPGRSGHSVQPQQAAPAAPFAQQAQVYVEQQPVAAAWAGSAPNQSPAQQQTQWEPSITPAATTPPWAK